MNGLDSSDSVLGAILGKLLEVADSEVHNTRLLWTPPVSSLDKLRGRAAEAQRSISSKKRKVNAVPPSSEWNVTPLTECPNCGRFLSLRVEKCPDCQELIDESYAFYSALQVTVITQACSFANSINTWI